VTEENPLAAACSLAYEVSRAEADAGSAEDLPPAMRSFLYVDELPARALTAAQEAMTERPSLRDRVGKYAREAKVGRVGYLWLTRPQGWASELEQLGAGHLVDTADSGDISLDGGGAFSFSAPSPAVEVSSSAAAVAAAAASSNGGGSSVSSNSNGGRSTLDEFEDDILEDELSSLRSLVDRLTGERKAVAPEAKAASPEPTAQPESHAVEPVVSNYSPAPSSVEASIFDNDAASLRTDLDTARHELALAKSELTAVRSERDEARKQHSESLKKQVSLERELAVTSEERTKASSHNSERLATISGLEDKLRRAKQQADDAERERAVMRAQLDALIEERNEVREDRTTLKAERDELAAQLSSAGGHDIGELVTDRERMSRELESTNRELSRLVAQVEHYEGQLATLTAAADSAKTEKIELRSRMSDTELSLETTRTQLRVVQSENERLTDDVVELRTERDDLESQLAELQESLSSMLTDQADIRQRHDADRAALSEVRVDRDVLAARVNELESSEKDATDRLTVVTAERDQLLAVRDELVEERGQLRGEAAAAAVEKTQLAAQIAELEGRLRPLETEVQSERRQREELANRLLELDDQAEHDASQLSGANEERERLEKELERLRADKLVANEVRVERDALQSRLSEADRRLSDETQRLSDEISELTDQLRRTEDERSALEHELRSMRTDLDGTRGDALEAGQQSNRLAAARDAALDDLERAKSVVVERDAEIDRLRGEIGRLRGDSGAAAPSSGRRSGPDLRPVPDDVPLAAFAPDPSSTDFDTTAVSEKPDTLQVQRAARPAQLAPSSDNDFALAPGTDSVGFEFPSPGTPAADNRAPAPGPTPGPGAPGQSPGWQVPAAEPEADDLDTIGDLVAQTVRGFDSGQSTSSFGSAALDQASSVVPERPAEQPDLGVRAVNRRQIEIPDDLLNDEIAMARYVVNSPDVVLLVDGDAVAQMGWPGLSVAERRDALVTYLGDLAANSGAAPDVVFDGRIADEGNLPSSRSVRIRLSTPPGEPAAALDELVDAYPEQWPIALVTDEMSLARAASDRGATVLNNGQLLDLFIAQ
jgi:chromosome segregation ATPase